MIFGIKAELVWKRFLTQTLQVSSARFLPVSDEGRVIYVFYFFLFFFLARKILTSTL